MPRARKGAARRQSKNKWFKQTKGYEGSRRKNWSRVPDAVRRAGWQAHRDRRARKRDFRRLWTTRITAACRQRSIPYSRFMAGLRAANIPLNRKMLSELAIHDADAFDAVVDEARSAAGEAQPQS